MVGINLRSDFAAPGHYVINLPAIFVALLGQTITNFTPSDGSKRNFLFSHVAGGCYLSPRHAQHQSKWTEGRHQCGIVGFCHGRSKPTHEANVALMVAFQPQALNINWSDWSVPHESIK